MQYKKFQKNKMTNRKGWESINAIKNDAVYEIDSSIILRPGPVALTDGLMMINDNIENWSKKNNPQKANIKVQSKHLKV